MIIFGLMQLLLMKRGGQVIYAGSLGHHSQKLIEYFEVIIHFFPISWSYEFVKYLSRKLLAGC